MNRKIKLYARKTMSIVLVIIMTVILIPLVSEKNVEAAMLNNPRKDSNGNVTYDCVWFGSYPQSDATGVKKDPIKWRVLEVNENDAFLVADCNLDVQMYNDTFTYVTWESCTMRKWLNSDFVNRAFTSSEQSAIKTTTVVNADNPYYGTEGGNNTKDKVFLLSLDEVMDEKYGFPSKSDVSNNTRNRRNTAYVAKGETIGMPGTGRLCDWWLRSPGVAPDFATFVTGSVGVNGIPVSSYNIAVCPALHLDIESSHLWAYAGTVNTNEIFDDGTQEKNYSQVTEDQLYAEYSSYLTNKSFGKMTGTLRDDMSEIVWSRSGWQNGLSALKSNMMGGVTGCIKSILGAMTGKYYDESGLEEQIALSYIQEMFGNTDVLGTSISDSKKKFKNIRNIYTILENGFKNVDEKKKFVEALSGGMFEKSEIYDLIRNTESEWDAIDKIFKKAGKVVNTAEVVASVIVTMQADNDLVTDLMKLISKDSALYRGLDKINKAQHKSIAGNIIEAMLKNKVFESVTKVLEEQGIGRLASLIGQTGGIEVGGATAIASIGYYILGSAVLGNIFGIASMEDVDKAVISVANQGVLSNALLEERTKIILNYKNGGNISIEQLKKEYQLLYNAYLQSIKSGVDYALKIAKGEQKSRLEKDYKKFKNMLTYKKYIKSCIENASAGYTYTVIGNQAKITSYNKDSSAKAKGYSVKKMRANAVSNLQVEDEMYYLDIPDEIDGYTVTGISDDAFSSNESIQGIYIPDTVESVGNNAFMDCENLNAVYIGANVKSIGDSVFYNCSNLQDIDIPYTVNQIGQNVFMGIESITIGGNNTVCEKYAQEYDNINFEQRKKSLIGISIKQYPEKMSYVMDDAIDSTGLEIEAQYEDGTIEEISNGIYCEFENKTWDGATISVNYNGMITHYDVEIVNDTTSRTYMIDYVNEYGDKIADSLEMEAVMGTNVDLPTPSIKGYIVDEDTTHVQVGEEKRYVVSYTSISKRSLGNADISYQREYVYTGNNIRPEVLVSYDGKILEEGTDYYIEYGDNVELGEGLIVVGGMGAYSGIVWNDFNIIEQATMESTTTFVPITTKEKVKPISTTVQTALGKGKAKASAITKIGKITAYKKSLKVTWKKVKSATGYEVQYGTVKKFKKAKKITIKGAKSTSKTIRKLKTKRIYYVRVRMYQMVAGKKIYGKWSKVKKKKTK